MTDFTIDTDSDLKIEHFSGRNEITFSADDNEVLKHFKIKDVVQYFGADGLLHEIGRDDAIEYFGIEVASDDSQIKPKAGN